MKRVALSFAAVLALGAVASPARADLLPEGMNYVPVELVLEGQSALADATIVIHGCNDRGGRHAFTIVKAGEKLECSSVKRPMDVRAVAKKDMKPLEDLYAKNAGWGVEWGESEKLLAKAPSCGKPEINGLVETSKNIDHLVAKYQIEKTATGCSLKKLGDLTPVTKDAKDSVATPATSGSAPVDKDALPKSAPSTSAAAPDVPSASPSPSGAASPTAPASASTGGCSRCSIDPVSTNGLAAIVTGLAFVLGLVARRRR